MYSFNYVDYQCNQCGFYYECISRFYKRFKNCNERKYELKKKDIQIWMYVGFPCINDYT